MGSAATNMESESLQSARLVVTATTVSSILLFAYIACAAAYNILFHPLRKYPGPMFWAVSRVPLALEQISGKPAHRIKELHQKYGDVIRIAPNELSFSHPDAWNEIYGHRKRSQEENYKDPIFYRVNQLGIFGADRENHARYRRILSRGFSAQTMLEQEPLITAYIDQLIERLRKISETGELVDLVKWFNFTTFDIIGDLAFGEPFGSLVGGEYHPWVALIFSNIKAVMLGGVAKHFPLLSRLLELFVPRSLLRKREEHLRLTHEKIMKRKKLEAYRPDFIEFMLRKEGSEKLSDEELENNTRTLIAAGSETTATALSGAMYLLMTNPTAMAKLTEEIRISFNRVDEINISGLTRLPYLNAVLEETLRTYPPVPIGMPRRAAAGGALVLGQYVPAHTLMSVWQWPLYHNAKWFSLPDSFIPERWLGDERFKDDRTDGMQPFAVGPRNCIGKNLAYAEMRLILAKFIWNFDARIADESRNWMEEQKMFLIWEKGVLGAYVTPRANQ